MYNLNQVQEIINRAIKEIDLSAEPSELYDPIRFALSVGGKRIRPALALMSCNLYKENIEDAIGPALGLEVFHNFTLLHDDIMDNAEIRRNNPTVHKKWGNNVAILSGDAMAIKSYDLLLHAPEIHLKEILKIFNRTAIEVCEGQQFDMNFEKRNFVTEDDYIQMIGLKTAVLLAASLQIGAIIGGADASDSKLIYEFGKNIGLAFQLQDDLLDVYGERKMFGKKQGNDILANKKTYMLIKALGLARGDDLVTMKNYLQMKEFNAVEKIKTFTEIYDRIGIRQLAELKINYYFSTAMDAFDAISVLEERKEELKNVVEVLMNRIA